MIDRNRNLLSTARCKQGVVAVCTVLAALTGNAALAQAAAASTAAVTEMDSKAVDALKNMGAYLRTLKTFSVHADTSKDEVLRTEQKIQFTSTVTIKAKLPSQLKIDLNSDRKQREIFFDGKTFTQYAPRMKYYGSVAAPGTIEDVIKVASDKFGLDVPLADLFYWGTEQSGLADITGAMNLGAEHVAGVACTHYAFRQPGVDWQIWIESGKAPLPRKIVITTLDEPSQPQYMAVLTWDLKTKLNDKTFSYVPSKGAQKIEFAPNAAAQ